MNPKGYYRTNKLTIDDSPLVSDAISRIYADYGDRVSVSLKKKSLLKFGINPAAADASTGYTIWATGADQAHETYVANNVNSIDKISSSNTSDTQTVVIEGHTDVAGYKLFVVQTATLSGQNKVTLSTPLNRCTRVYNSSNVNFAGSIYVYEDTSISSGKPSDTTKIHLTVRSGSNQSEKASTSISYQDYWIITTIRGSVLQKTAVTADVKLEVRPRNNVFREVEDVTTSQGSPGFIKFEPYVIAPPNSDVRLVTVTSSASPVSVSGSIFGYLAKIIPPGTTTSSSTTTSTTTS